MKLKLLSVLSLFGAVLFFSSCEKELSFENGGVPGSGTGGTSGGTALYEFEGAPGSCTGATLGGTYTAGTALTSANTVTVQVYVDSIGTYTVSTSTLNGISFNGSDSFTIDGPQTITLIGSGTPTTGGTFNYTVGTDGCTFSVTIAPNGGSGNTSVYSFDGGIGSCTGALLNGTYTAGTAVSSANTAVLNVNVTSVGTYTITTNSVNGIAFGASGTFTTTGPQPVTLTATGTPAAAGVFTYTPGSNGCSFNVTVNPSGGGGANFLRCKIGGVFTNFNTSLVGYNIPPPSAGIPYSVSAQGKNSDVAGSLEELWVTVKNPTPATTGVYSNGTISSGMTDRACQVGFYPTGFPNLYWGSSALTANTFTVNLTSITATTATGTFSGTIYESNGIGPLTKQITEGEFQISF